MIFGKAMEDNLQKNQEFMQEIQRVTLERNIQMQNQMREKMMVTLDDAYRISGW